MPRPAWLASGDTTEAHRLNLAKIAAYLAAIRSDGRGLPADSSRPFVISYPLVAKESGVNLGSLNRKRSQCRKMIEDEAREGLEIHVRLKHRVRPTYTIEEAINIAVAVIHAECELVRGEHRPKCKMADRLLRQIARSCSKGLHDDSIKAVSAALGQSIYSDEEHALLAEISDILLRATRGELELQTFHGRLKLESALVGISLSAVSKFTNARFQTVINWGAGIKAPTLSFIGEISKIEKIIGCPAGYLSSVHRSNRSGSSNVKKHYLPEKIRAMSVEHQKQFRRLIDESLNISELSDEERETLMTDKLRIFNEDRDTIDFKRAKLRSPDMRYGLRSLPGHVQQEFDDLVANRTNVTVQDRVKSRKRGWDEDTRGIYHKRFRLFLGWLHFGMGVAEENLSIAYLAFDQVLREYDIYLIERKYDVGMERRWAQSAREWLTFAASLTRGLLGRSSGRERRDHSASDVGWLRGRRDLLSKIGPIKIPRAADEMEVEEGKRDDVRPVLTALEIEEATRNWSKRLNETTEEYHHQEWKLAGETTRADSVTRVLPIFRLPKPLMAIEHGAWELRKKTVGLRVGAFHWCTAIRESIALKFHAQVPLRRQTFCWLTYDQDNSGMVFQEGGRWWIKIPADLFKNEKSQAFQDLLVDGFYTVPLEDGWGLYEDLHNYVTLAREGILSGVESTAFYVTRHNKGHVTPGTFAGLFRSITRNYIAENRGRGTGLRGVKPFGSQAMRHIVASAVYKHTGSLAAAALAIHDSEKITEKHYRKYFMDPEERGTVIRDTMRTEDGSFVWSKFGEILPRIPSPSTAPPSQSPVVQWVSYPSSVRGES
jgi:hypothetical protein